MDPAISEPIKPLSNFTPQSDPSKFIRTYAKDFAALSGHEPDTLAPPPAVTPAPPATKIISDEGVALPDYDPSPVERDGSVSPKDFPQEAVDLRESDSDGIFKAQGSAPAAVPLIPQPATPAPSVFSAPSPAPLVTEASDAPEERKISEHDREEILARLRAKVSSMRDVETTAPITSPPPIRTGAPDFSHTPEPVLPIPQVSKTPIPAPSPVSPAETPSPIHTFSSDFADRIDTEGASTFSVLAAQSDAKQKAAMAPRKRSFAPLLAGGAMLVIGIAAIAGAYFFTKSGSFAPSASSVPSLISFDESVEVKGSGQALMRAVSDIGNGGSVHGNVVVTYVTLATTTGTGIPQPGGVIINEMGLHAPSILLRNIADSSTVGVVRAGSEARPFMILKVNSYERTFAGMLAWEPSMEADLATFYPAYASAQMTGTSTASSSPKIMLSHPTSFSDAVVDNYDVRVLRDASGRSLMLYGYKGKDLLIIARDEAAFTALITRLNAAGN